MHKYSQRGVKLREYNKKKREEKIRLWKEGKIDGRRGKTATAYWIRDYMLDKCQNKCEECGWSEINKHTGKIPLELDHKDGNYLNNLEENLIILCPNCHALTATYKGANKQVGRPRAKYYRGL